MYVDQSIMPSDSRIWIYQSDRPFTPEETITIMNRAKEFIASWTAHQQDLKGSCSILHDIFLVIMIDEKHASASGCSIDKSFHFIHTLERDFSLSLLDRQRIAFRKDGKIEIAGRKEFEALLLEHRVDASTMVFNNLIQTKGELAEGWEIPLKNSWHSAIRVV